MNDAPVLKRTLSSFAVLLFAFLFFSCISVRPGREEVSRFIRGQAVKDESQLAEFFMSLNPSADESEVKEIASYYVAEASDEGINSDVAFVQMCLETGFLRFGGLVSKEMHNYCGLGSIDSSAKGASFDSMQLGVRAHIQHLQAYATTEEVQLRHELIDPRYSWPHKAYLVHDVRELAGKWATDPEYGVKLENLILRLEEF